MKKRWIALLLLLLAVAGVSGYKLVTTLLDYREASEFYGEMAEDFVRPRPADRQGATQPAGTQPAQPAETQPLEAQPGAESEAQSEPQASQAQPNAENEAQSEPQVSQAQPNAESEAQSEPQSSQTQPNAEGDAQSEPQSSQTQPGAEGDAQSEPQSSQTQPGAEGEAQSEPRAEAQSTESMPDSEAVASSNPQAEAQSAQPLPNAVGETRQTGTGPEAQQESPSGGDAEPQSNSPTGEDAETQTESPSGRDAETPSESSSGRDAEPKAESPSGEDAESQSETPTGGDAESQSESPSGENAEVQSEAPSGGDAESGAEAQTEIPELYTWPEPAEGEAALLLRSTEIQPPIQVDFQALKAVNPDVVGWIYCEDTLINYPVLQGRDNDQYLHRMLNGRRSPSGSIFLDSLCAPDFSGENSLLYGHHMKDGSMFAGLEKFKDQEYYDAHSVMWLLTPERDYMIQIFAGFLTETDGWIYYVSFGEDAVKLAYVQDAFRRTFFKCDVAPVSEDRLITLSTCDYTFKNARFVVVGLLVPVLPPDPEEVAEVTEPAVEAAPPAA